jgi:2-hydroxychromene-2-carboxylate isomerase
MSVEVCSASTTRVLAFPIESEQVTVLDPGGSSKRFRGRAGDVDRFSKLRGDAELAVYIDLKSPYAFIAIEPTRAMAAALGVLIDWRPFTLDIPSYLGSARLDERGRVASSERTPQQWTGVRYAYRDARRYASLRGKTLRGTEKIWDSSLAGIAMLWAKQQGVEIFERVLEASLGRSGAEVDGFRAYATGAGRVAHDALNRDAFDAGVFGVPTYLVGDEMWFGREHLPRVAWLLGGRSGPAPDVANRAFGA